MSGLVLTAPQALALRAKPAAQSNPFELYQLMVHENPGMTLGNWVDLITKLPQMLTELKELVPEAQAAIQLSVEAVKADVAVGTKAAAIIAGTFGEEPISPAPGTVQP